MRNVCKLLLFFVLSGFSLLAQSSVEVRLSALEEKVEWLESAEESRFEYQITRFYRGFLGREPDESGLRHWVKAAMDGMPLDDIGDAFLSSDEYQLRMQNMSKSYPEAEKPFSWKTPYELSQEGSPRRTEFWLQAAHLHLLADPAVLQRFVDQALEEGWTGLQTVVETTWVTFDPNKRDFTKIDQYVVNPKTFELIGHIWNRLNAVGLSFNVWIWGDSDKNLNPLKPCGLKSAFERSVYAGIQSHFGGLPNLFFTVGHDEPEWLTVDYCQWIVEQMPDVFVSARSFDGRYDKVTGHPNRMNRTYKTADLEQLAAENPHASLVISGDRCRYKGHDMKGSPESEGHIELDEMLRIIRDCKRLGISIIVYYVSDSKSHTRYMPGSEKFPEWFIAEVKKILNPPEKKGEYENS